jgi:hypothetical protein
MQTTPAGDGQKLGTHGLPILANRLAVLAFATCHSIGARPAVPNLQTGKTASTKFPSCQPIGQRVVPLFAFGALLV